MSDTEQDARSAATEIEQASASGVMASVTEHLGTGEWYVTVDMDVAVARRFADWLRSQR
jgi:AmiR/NasT family two-component response regulator